LGAGVEPRAELLTGVGVDDGDAVGLEEGEDLLDFIRRGGDLVGERLVDLVVREKAPLLADGQQLADLFVLGLETRDRSRFFLLIVLSASA